VNNSIFVTGGAGFIGSAVVRYLYRDSDVQIVNIDKLTYAGNLETLHEVDGDARYKFHRVDICDSPEIEKLFSLYQPKGVMHLAAESHVDRSIDGPEDFMQTNIVGTYRLLECARRYWVELSDGDKSQFRFHHISTDEVFGSLGDEGLFTETTPYSPRSPYSASKASSDHLVRAWHDTYGLPTVVSNCSNNYGLFQFPEKFLPVIITKAVNLQPIPIYGAGTNVRDWLHVEDHARALWKIFSHGEVGDTYNVGGHAEKTNLEVVHTVCELLDKIKPARNGKPYSSLIEFVTDRPGHDQRYAIDASKIINELGWQPQETFESGMLKTIEWYLDNIDWVERVSADNYQGQRLGLGGD